MASPPVIDFAPFLREEGAVVGAPATDAQAAVLRALDAVNRSTGFAYLDNVGITQEDLRQWFAGARELFAQPEDHKLRGLQQLDPSANVGYSPVGQERLNASRPADLKESFNVKRPGTNTFEGCPERFVDAAQGLWAKAEVAMRRFALACALALDLEPDFFSKRLRSMDQVTVRFLRYPPCDFDPAAAGGHGPLRIGEHTDFGLFTLLFLDGPAEGLEVKKVAGGEVGGSYGGEDGGWTPVQGLGGATFVVNTGALFARWTNDHWRATAHRVVVPSAAAAAGERYSIACFCDPDADADVTVHPRFLAPGEVAKYPPTTAGEYVLMKLRQTNAKPGEAAKL
mmetsp:Transcript_69126/g.214563  ORF Transcript_69126/g.214563 Transcript_69126/m.214563 type:complete len:340 (+) Transcript_69126:118-1137(+)